MTTLTTIKFLIPNPRNPDLKTYCAVVRLYPEHRRIRIEFSREEVGDGQPARRWLAVSI